MNTPIKSHALLYQRVENTIKNSSEPLTANDLVNAPAIRELGLQGTPIQDALDSLRGRELIRRIPAAPKAGDRCRWAFEWIKKAEPIAEKPCVTGFLGNKPEIIVSAHKVVVITNNIKITVEY